MINYDNITIPEATKIQHALKKKLLIEPYTASVKTIAGADISFNKFSTTVYAGIILLSFPELRPLAYSLVTAEVHFPYVPGYLAFREVPALKKAWDLSPKKPDVLIIDGHGIAHPRRMGIAAHFGALTGQATIGCAKKLLFGKYEGPGVSQKNFSFIYDKDEIIGCALRTKNKVKPVFISPGNKVDIPNSLELVSKCIGKYRIPEPTRLAHQMVNLFRMGKLQEGYYLVQQSLL